MSEPTGDELHIEGFIDMPWTVADVERHNKNLSDKQKRQWVHVANDALQRCLDAGGKECEASAIKQANASVTQKDGVTMKFLKSREEKQILYGIIFEPDFVDAHDEFVEKDDIEEAAHGYMIRLQNEKGSMIKLSHQIEIDKEADIVECYVAPVDFEMGDEKVKKGSWVVAIKIWNKDLWDATKDEISGLSAGGWKTFT